ncbi:hypothetical protein B0I35DRAFT_422944 [Stachybotrys elegans]|uniref:Uncharacterized protein n=1 Tax=Stachybotrys elegans TaxID=80388 RepID=A0A8K0WX43_9HYPO|nr:hypothetical protein B0I35DRAFT_422944 [Stachybotrys elegans]
MYPREGSSVLAFSTARLRTSSSWRWRGTLFFVFVVLPSCTGQECASFHSIYIYMCVCEYLFSSILYAFGHLRLVRYSCSLREEGADKSDPLVVVLVNTINTRP